MNRRALLRRAAAALAVLALPRGAAAGRGELVSFPSREVELLLGPLPKPGSPEDWEDLEKAELSLAKKYAAGFPEAPDDLVASTYYDLALVLYQASFRFDDEGLRERARSVAVTWRGAPGNRALEEYLGGKWDLGPLVPPGRSMATLGLAVHALEAKDAASRKIVREQAELASRLLRPSDVPGVPPGDDSRECAYGIMAMVAATILGDDRRKDAQGLVDQVLAKQMPDGGWRGVSSLVEGPWTLHYMNGLLMEALVLFDRAFGDRRIVPAIEKAIGWTWREFWVEDAGGFRYGDRNAGSIDTKPAPVLNGLLLPGWGYVYARTGDAEVRRRGEAILRGLVEKGFPEIFGVKQFDQVFRSASRFLGFLVERDVRQAAVTTGAKGGFA